MVASAEVVVAIVTTVVRRFLGFCKQLVVQVASIAAPSIAGTSISAVSPDALNFERGLALGTFA